MRLTMGKKITVSIVAILIIAAIVITTSVLVLGTKFDVKDNTVIEKEEKVNLEKTTLQEAVSKMKDKYKSDQSDYWHFYIYGTKEQIAKVNKEDAEYSKYSYTIMEINDDVNSNIIGNIVETADNRTYLAQSIDTAKYPIYLYALSRDGKKTEIDRTKLDYSELMMYASGLDGRDRVCFAVDNKIVGVANISTEIKSVKYQGSELKVPVVKYDYWNFVEKENGGMVKKVRIASNFITDSSVYGPIYEGNKIYISDDEIGYKIMAVTPTVYKNVRTSLVPNDPTINDGAPMQEAIEFEVDTDIEQYQSVFYYAEVLRQNQGEYVNRIAIQSITIEINGKEYSTGLHYEGVVDIA